MEDFSSTGQLVTLGLVDSSIGAMAKGLTLVDVEVSYLYLISHFICNQEILILSVLSVSLLKIRSLSVYTIYVQSLF